MSNNKKKKDKAVTSKTNQQKEDIIKIPLTVYQHNVISMLLFIITGSSRMDQLGDVIYTSLRFVENCRVRPLICHINAARFDKYKKMDGKTCGTGLTGRGYKALERYCEYLLSIFQDEFSLRSFDFGELIIALLLFYILSDSDKRVALASEDVYSSMLVIYSNEIESVRLCIFNLEEGWVDDQEVYPIKDFLLSIISGNSSRILDEKSLFITDAYRKSNNHPNAYANSVILRMRALINDMDKTDNSKRKRWKLACRLDTNVDV